MHFSSTVEVIPSMAILRIWIVDLLRYEPFLVTFFYGHKLFEKKSREEREKIEVERITHVRISLGIGIYTYHHLFLEVVMD